MWYRRAFACAALSGLIAAGTRARAQDPVRIAQAHNATVGVIAGDAGSTDTQIAAEMAEVLDDGTRLRVLPILGQGSPQNIADLIFLKGVDVAIVHADALTQAIRSGNVPRVESVEYIAKLFQEEVHVLAQRPIVTLDDLTGKPVEIGAPDSGTALTATALLAALHIRPDPLHDSQSVALDRLRLGQVAAVVVVGGKPVPALLGIPPASGLHFLPIPLNARLVDTYLPSSLDSMAYPNLLPLGQTVDTVAVGSMLVTIARQPDTARAKRVDRFVSALFTQFDAFRRPGFHPKWHDVSLSAQIPGLRRYPEAEKLLRTQSNAAAQPGRERHSGP
ncbi:MAG TPA: TAXI family TRAP transporter solute-binding subunit [Rhodopila sp.]|nr:TAXI family TRAP transporter solute-binding subunit [Rhodopila sp.]